MIVLDTNVVSESRKQRRDAIVAEWLARMPQSALYLTTTVVAELGAGVATLPNGRRRLALQDDFDLAVDHDFAGRILSFDIESARAYAHILEVRRRRGHPIQVADAQIAAVCLVHDAALATRDTGGFEGLGLTIIDPWQGL